MENRLGLGLVLGMPTGITGKYWLPRNRGLDGAIAWNLSDGSSLTLLSTYLFHRPSIFKIQKEAFDLYYGIGGRLESVNKGKISSENSLNIGVRTLIGLEYFFHDPSIEPFCEISATLNLIESTDFLFGFGIGVRYIF